MTRELRVPTQGNVTFKGAPKAEAVHGGEMELPLAVTDEEGE